MNLNYVPDLAKSWEILENGKVYVFQLRKGVKFHEDSNFGAEVVHWNYQRAAGYDAPDAGVPASARYSALVRA